MKQVFRVLVGLLLCAAPLLAQGRGHLDGEEKSFVVTGYSTSKAWPGMLQELLDLHAASEGDPRGTYHVFNAYARGASLGMWLGVTGMRDRKRSWYAMVEKYFDPGEGRKGAPLPTIALCQQSTQGVFGGEPGAGIRDQDDEERIEEGAGAYLELAEQLHELGVETVYLASHIFKRGYEPFAENEKYALELALEKGERWIRRGPDMWAAFRDHDPEWFGRDGQHPSAAGSEALAIAWYKTVAGREADEDLIEDWQRRRR